MCVLQTVTHLAVVLGTGHVDTVVDLDRSNGIPDLLSTLALGVATAGAAAMAARGRERIRMQAAGLAVVLAVLTLADGTHDGPHPANPVGWLVILAVLAAVALTTSVAVRSSPRTRVALAGAAGLLAASFFVNGLDRLDGWFERERPDPIVEYQIAAKEGFELLGWSVASLALWNEASRRRRPQPRTQSDPSTAQVA